MNVNTALAQKDLSQNTNNSLGAETEELVADIRAQIEDDDAIGSALISRFEEWAMTLEVLLDSTNYSDRDREFMRDLIIGHIQLDASHIYESHVEPLLKKLSLEDTLDVIVRTYRNEDN